jgi:hypothetical protein
MIITKKTLSRRTILRGIGACLALPALEAMRPALSAAVREKAVRSVFIYVPNGMTMGDWTPKTAGADYEMTPILSHFAPYRSDMMVLSGLMDHNGNALGDGGGDHARAGGSFMTGVHPAKTSGRDIKVGISVDQLAANGLGSATRLRSLELGCEDSRTVGNCDSGYSCAYSNSLSWRGPSTPNPPENNPRAVFERLFGADDITLPPDVRAKRLADRKSILDSVQDQVRSLLGTVGGSDRRKLDEYLTAVREIEMQIQAAEKKGVVEVTSGFEKPAGIPFAFGDYVKIMFSLAAAALQTDSTRVVTVVLGREGSLRTYNEIGVSEGHHPLSHHGNRAESLQKMSRINAFHTQLASEFIGKLKASADGDGTLLDHSMVLYGSALSDSNRHIHENLPIVLFGRGNGSLKPGRHVVLGKNTPMTNLYLTMLDQMGVNVEQMGDSTGKIDPLSL